MSIYKLYPAIKDYLWGGSKLVDSYGKVTDKSPVAESWELSFHKDGLSSIADGRTLKEALSDEELGQGIDREQFPMLIKFIDASKDLSVQVHPDDAYAGKYENSYGKTEAWYIMEAEDGAGIYLGFNRDVSEQEYRDAIADGTLTDLLNFVRVTPGECYFIPAGTVHAIGKGCMICEIQQNSNITYRVYDYCRRDKDGNLRELHIEKAVAVSSRKRIVPHAIKGGILAMNKYFTLEKIEVSGKVKIGTNGSFITLICLNGWGKAGEVSLSRGESVFVTADENNVEVDGKMEMLKATKRNYYIGIDLGGTFIKGGITDNSGNIIFSDKIPTESEKGAEAVTNNIVRLCKLLLEKTTLSFADILGIGIGVPGMIDSKNGEVVYSNNLAWEHFMIADAVQKQTGVRVKIANDANVAALGETKFGSGKKYRNTVMLTLGTGVGGGIIIDGKLFEGNQSAGAELGHSVICRGGEKCTCGRRGCFETYASATALIRETKKAMKNHPDSKMWEIGNEDNVTGKTSFDFYGTDPYAKEVVDSYIDALAEGICNIANVFRPEAVILGGGVCAQGDNLLLPLRQRLDSMIYAGDRGPGVDIIVANLGNNAGILGATALVCDD